MKSTDTGAHVSTRTLIAIQVVLEESIANFSATIQSHSSVNGRKTGAFDRQVVGEMKPLLREAQRLWRAIENTHIARRARRGHP